MKYRYRILTILLVGLTSPAFAADANPSGQQNGPGASLDRRSPLSEAQRDKLKAMTPAQRQHYFQAMRQEYLSRRQDRDNNPPGPTGGPGTNWENRPGPQGGPGASPDQRPPLSEALRNKLKAMTAAQRQQYFQAMRQEQLSRRQRPGDNPPGPVGGPGTNLENHPGSQGDAGARIEPRSE